MNSSPQPNVLNIEPQSAPEYVIEEQVTNAQYAVSQDTTLHNEQGDGLEGCSVSSRTQSPIVTMTQSHTSPEPVQSVVVTMADRHSTEEQCSEIRQSPERSHESSVIHSTHQSLQLTQAAGLEA